MASAVQDYKYSVPVKGRFDLLANVDYNSEDPEHLIRKMRSQKLDTKTVEVDNVSPPKAVEKPTETGQRDQPREARGKGPRGRGGFSRSRGTPTGGQRQFDRHSGSDKTGVKPVMKKGGHGTGNWGTIEDELEAQTAEPVLEVPVEKEAPAEQSAAEPEQPAEPEEEVPKTLTLKEYKEQKVKAKVELSTKGARRANDGKNVFSNMVEVHKSKPVEDVLPDVLEEKQEEKNPKPVFFDFSRGGEVGRGRGGPRPSGPGEFRGRGRGGPRFQQRASDQQEPSTGEVAAEGSSAIADAPTSGRPFSRGGRGGERGGRGFGRGRGGPRGGSSFNPERGMGRGGGSFNPERGGRGSFNHERGAGRGGGSFNPERGAGRGGASFNGERGAARVGAAGGDRPSFRGARGGPRGGSFRGRGHQDGEHRHIESSHQQHEAPVMDSEADFPALK